MEAPKCRLCGDRHWGQCQSGKKGSSSEEGEGRRGKSQTRASPVDAGPDGTKAASAAAKDALGRDSNANVAEPEVASGPLTETYEERAKRLNRERQKRYRERMRKE